MKERKVKTFKNGSVYVLETNDGYLVEVTDTFLPYYTKDCINEKSNELKSEHLGDRTERWMIGISCMSGCNVGCKFCATGQMKKFRCLSAEEMVAQVRFILEKNKSIIPSGSKEFKINYTRMGEPALNWLEVQKAVKMIDELLEGTIVHHYISTIGIKGTDFSWIKDNITLQLSLHSLDESRRDELIPCSRKMSIKELGEVRTKSALKTTLNMTLVDELDFDINILKGYFDKDYFFIKLSPINENDVSKANEMGAGVIKAKNIL